MNKKTILWIVVTLVAIYLVVLILNLDSFFLTPPKKGVVHDPDIPGVTTKDVEKRMKCREVGHYWVFTGKKHLYENPNKLCLVRGQKVWYHFKDSTETIVMIDSLRGNIRPCP